jgi:phosphatidate cytidylyltransferase
LTIAVPTSWFAAAVVCVAAVALWEFCTMVMSAERLRMKPFAIGAGVIILLVAVFALPVLVPLLSIIFMAFAIYYLYHYHDINTVIAEISLLVMAWVYIPLLLSPMVLLHALPAGRRWVLLVLIMTMVCDSCAYFVGSAIGRHRLYPAISPKKSIEGAVGGLVGSVLVALTAQLWLLPQISWVDCLIVGLLAGIFGQLGDLFESMLKRYANIKDSGTIFPGHGGMLDRIDSLLFSFPAVYAYVYTITVVFTS